FLSDEQYKEFYWDTLLRLVNDLIDHGLTPWVYTEGPYNSRIECLMDVPKGKCLIHFEQADMKRAKKLLGDVACLSGGISSHMLMSGTREEVVDKVKENIDILAPGGGYIFDLGDSMGDCKPELVEAMFDTVKTYGKY
ncbi:MAG: uroporphyrinogen decarboxylase family protein, partial [Oscillospiraceae bacterium]|nr:uroporphyrinogen decarboxylase family protein [Oscillospiraceae bacterium]